MRIKSSKSLKAMSEASIIPCASYALGLFDSTEWNSKVRSRTLKWRLIEQYFPLSGTVNFLISC